MLNLKTQEESLGQETFDDTNPFSPTFGTPAYHIYIPLLPRHNESKCAICKTICCVVIFAVIVVLAIMIATMFSNKPG